jgi:hypothetical protein
MEKLQLREVMHICNTSLLECKRLSLLPPGDEGGEEGECGRPSQTMHWRGAGEEETAVVSNHRAACLASTSSPEREVQRSQRWEAGEELMRLPGRRSAPVVSRPRYVEEGVERRGKEAEQT